MEDQPASVTLCVTPREKPPRHAWSPSAARCLCCGEVLDGRGDQRTCSDACRKAVSRRRRKLVPLVRLVLMAVEGVSPDGDTPRFWGLIRLTVQRERAKLRAELKARQLPGRRVG